ncbi:MspA family porin [Gordonia sp. CPCC 205333]|uniref:MspA family porin n=1 Tax=Gordonia sp. CPCC 205333 TaxID=3140790 RepID=UPI003AF3D726
MSTNKSSVRRGAFAGVLAGAAAVGIAVTGVAPAHADAFVRLPSGSQAGDGLQLIRNGESARISPSLSGNGLGRTAWVTGNVVLKAPNLKSTETQPNNGPLGESASPGTNGTFNDGSAATLSVGYIVGCQVQIGNLSAGISGSINQTGTPSGTGSISLPISPGQVVFAQLDYKNIKKKGTYYFSWKNTQLQIQNCAGYAQARSFVTVETSGENHQKVNLYGKPFSIG